MLLDPGNYEEKMVADGSGVTIKEPSINILFTDEIPKLEEAEELYASGNCDRVLKNSA
jgi:hypothetical protein